MANGYEMDDGHLLLLNWARWYRSLFDMSAADRPTDALVENDAELDRWFESYIHDMQRKSGKARGSPILNAQSNIPTFGG